MEVIYKNIREKRIKLIFKEVLNHYPALKQTRIVLHQKKMPKTTMRAQPELFSLWQNTPTYKVELSNNTDLADMVRISEVPDDVLYGWFAHEIGHVMDYLERGFFGMIWFGLRYYFSVRFRIRTEHKADKIAIRHGLAESILITKRHILEHCDLPEKYKKRIRKYYMSADNVMQLQKAEKNTQLKMDEVDILNPSSFALKGEKS